MNPYMSYSSKSLTAIILVTVCSCAPFPNIQNPAPLVEREQGTVLIIGCVIVEYSLQDVDTPYTIILAYQPPDPTHDQLKTIWVRTDSSGYYSLANMPMGKYSLAGVYAAGLNLMLWYDPLEAKGLGGMFSPAQMSAREGDEPWVRIHTTSNIRANRVYFPHPRKPTSWLEPHANSIYNFGYLVLTNERRRHASVWWIVHSHHYDSLNGETFILDKEYYLPPVPEYFMDKHPDSEWVPFLATIKP